MIAWWARMRMTKSTCPFDDVWVILDAIMHLVQITNFQSQFAHFEQVCIVIWITAFLKNHFHVSRPFLIYKLQESPHFEQV